MRPKCLRSRLPSCPGGIMMRRDSADFWASVQSWGQLSIMMLLWVADVEYKWPHTVNSCPMFSKTLTQFQNACWIITFVRHILFVYVHQKVLLIVLEKCANFILKCIVSMANCVKMCFSYLLHCCSVQALPSLIFLSLPESHSSGSH